MAELQLPHELSVVGAEQGYVGILALMQTAFDNGRVLGLSRLDQRLERFQKLLVASKGRPVLATLIDSVDCLAQHVQPGDDEHEKSGGAWLDPLYSFYIKWRIYAMLQELHLRHVQPDVGR